MLYSAVAGQTMKNTEIENYTAFILPGIVVLVSFSTCSNSGIVNYMMKSDGSFYRVLIAPIKRSSIVLGQLLEAVLCTFLEVGIMGCVSLLFHVRLAAGITGIFLIWILVFLTAFFMAGLAYGISLILPNEEAAAMKHIPYRQNPTVIDISKKSRSPPGEIQFRNKMLIMR